eukprot:TRINITY_DN1567_c0_g2_i2.p1 TRINITY_DN1567_c0_g2~~TRINITY_DN1567_c0_g2_i2.p1  ORF type:complete len:495 (-),score=130.05 TRINITY_DN1567_c0_g2_i2:151-1512(-)
MPDPTFSWHVNSTIQGANYKAYVVRVISQTWLTSRDSDSSVWQHWLTVCVPDTVTAPYSFVYVDGGSTHDPPPKTVFPLVEVVCMTAKVVTAYFTQIPNEPVVFAGDPGHKRSEDAFIAYTWYHFLNNMTEPYWLARLPMTKAVVRAMDTIQGLTKTLPGVPAITGFAIAGASKRGWTTWTTGAVDSRVIAIIPIVMPILNMVPNMGHQWQAYGNWSFALDDYLALDLMKYLNQPQFKAMAAIIDPYSYIDRLTMPKYIIASTGDEFFLPDSPQFFMPAMKGETHLRMIPNCEHSLAGHQADVTLQIETFLRMVINKQPRPQITWTNQYYSNGSALLVATTSASTPPSLVRLWQADTLSRTQRDFRLVTCFQLPKCIQLVPWKSTEIKSTTQGSNLEFKAFIEAPNYGWRGYMFDFDWAQNGPLGDFTFASTTEVFVTPDKLPFPPCGDNCQP